LTALLIEAVKQQQSEMAAQKAQLERAMAQMREDHAISAQAPTIQRLSRAMREISQHPGLLASNRH
jgi:hypothetical protein